MRGGSFLESVGSAQTNEAISSDQGNFFERFSPIIGASLPLAASVLFPPAAPAINVALGAAGQAASE